MNLKNITSVCLASLLVVIAIKASSESSLISKKEICKGLIYERRKELTKRGLARIHLLKIQIEDEKIEVIPKFAKEKIGEIEKVSDIAKRENAIAAVNGTFFDAKNYPHLPIGTIIINGRLIYDSLYQRTAMGISQDQGISFGIINTDVKVTNPKNGTSFKVWGVNRPRKENEIILYTREYGKSSRTSSTGKELIILGNKVIGLSSGNSKIPNDGYVISFHGWNEAYIKWFPIGSKIKLDYTLPLNFANVDYAITGGPILVDQYSTMTDYSLREEYFEGRLLLPTARTAVGVGYDNEDLFLKDKLLYLIVVDKDGSSVGMTYKELAQFMHKIGVKAGMGLDGGATSTMYIDGEVVNSPLTGKERPVSNALIVKVKGYEYTSSKKLVSQDIVAEPQEENHSRDIFNLLKGLISVEAF